ncbi:MAG: hypothetical protein IJ424_04340 [Oscillospiraceae bacterium]|nr:hypothetical protein [Oscillospiraceae bacterium]
MLRLIDGFGCPNPVLAKADRQLWDTKAVLAATDVFSFGWIWASNRDAC